MKAIFIGSKQATTTTFLSFDIRITVGPLEVYLKNLKSLRSVRNLPVLRQKVLKPPKSAVFPRAAQRICFRCLRSLRKTEEAEKDRQGNSTKVCRFRNSDLFGFLPSLPVESIQKLHRTAFAAHSCGTFRF